MCVCTYLCVHVHMTVWPNQCVTLALSSDTVVCEVYLAVFVLIYIQLNFYFIFWRSWIPCSFPCFILCCIVCRAKTFTRIIREMVLFLLLLYYWLLTVAASHVYIVGVKSQSWVIMRQSLLHWHGCSERKQSTVLYVHAHVCMHTFWPLLVIQLNRQLCCVGFTVGTCVHFWVRSVVFCYAAYCSTERYLAATLFTPPPPPRLLWVVHLMLTTTMYMCI